MNSNDNGGAVLRGGPAVVVPGHARSLADTPDAASRIPGLDAARGLAILGMLAAHTLHVEGDAFYDGRSSIMFAVLAGISLGLMTGGRPGLPRASRGRARLSIFIRGLLLIALGLGLWMLGTNVAIILDTYGLLFLLCLPLIFANRWVLVAIAVVCAIIGPLAVGAIVDYTGSSGPSPVTSEDLAAIPRGWLAGYYPAPVWLGYVIVGLALARFGITRGRILFAMVVGGSIVAILGYSLSAGLGHPVVAHTDTTAEAVSSGSLVIAVIGLLVYVMQRARGKTFSMVLRPLTSAGSMPLTIYTAQVLVLALLSLIRGDGAEYSPVESGVLFACLALGSLVFAVLWGLRFRQGPLEWLFARLTLRRPWRSAARL